MNQVCFIVIYNVPSTSANFESGVPQGYVLGLLLFLVFMFPLVQVISKTMFSFFTDDTQLYICFLSSNHACFKACVTSLQ